MESLVVPVQKQSCAMPFLRVGLVLWSLQCLSRVSTSDFHKPPGARSLYAWRPSTPIRCPDGKTVTFSADDFGLTASVNEGIERAPSSRRAGKRPA